VRPWTIRSSVEVTRAARDVMSTMAAPATTPTRLPSLGLQSWQSFMAARSLAWGASPVKPRAGAGLSGLTLRRRLTHNRRVSEDLRAFVAAYERAYPSEVV